MFGNWGFSYVGLLFLLMLFIPNIIWSRKKPQGYTSTGENKILLFFKRTGEIMTCCCSLMFSDFNIHKWTPWSLWLITAFIFMIMHEANSCICLRHRTYRHTPSTQKWALGSTPDHGVFPSSQII